ncbi:MAG: methionine--tRNA ligase [Candidatus Kerfeldbacteria bacterium CG08_land_8_20_14_0_20_43_14]|uniref:Methionine--tRNA ligase n=1 Tax=Candidatus Kerfeldbacteria bacterium CG08_land_8_20_14_0_20_43_14 TaxID=2014246 RepID=A0A2H0YTH5_9BACT|nr:MAG: methionine--tRNA ligase [Candidatus Kerfeldbacteria bacterium CG08_land_8_20_14_0_20_43_14]
MKKNLVPLLITTPIYYANAAPHLGSAYTTIAADVLARYWRSKGRKVFLLTGTDEHGSKVAESASKAGVLPQAFVDQQARVFKAAFEQLNISFNRFIRTTEADHVLGAKLFLEKLKKVKTPKNNPAVYKGEYRGLYCQGCERFLTEKELVDGKCPLHFTEPQKLVEHNYFFRLSDYLPGLKKALAKGSLKIFPKTSQQEVLGYFKQGVQDFSISRQNVKWGIPLPFDKTQTAYVWVDALPNYLTGIGFGKNTSYRNWWRGEVVHFMARDILKFHAIYWPALLTAIGEPPPNTIVAHGFSTVDGKKMSKSLGNVIAPSEMISKYGVDGTRYLLLSAFPFGQDGDLPVDRFTEKFNTDLANGLGNLVSRTTNMVERYLNGKVKISKSPKSLIKAEKLIQKFAFSEALTEIWRAITWANQAIDKAKPWELAKSNSKADTKKIETLLCGLIAELKEIGQVLRPFLPETAKTLENLLKQKRIIKSAPLFMRVL